MTLTITIQQFFLLIFYPPLIGALVGIAVERLSSHHTRKEMESRELETDRRQAIQNTVSTVLTDREETVAAREQALRDGAQEVAAVLRASHDVVDTRVSRLDWDDLPRPGQREMETDATREIPVIE